MRNPPGCTEYEPGADGVLGVPFIPSLRFYFPSMGAKMCPNGSDSPLAGTRYPGFFLGQQILPIGMVTVYTLNFIAAFNIRIIANTAFARLTDGAVVSFRCCS